MILYYGYSGFLPKHLVFRDIASEFEMSCVVLNHFSTYKFWRFTFLSDYWPFRWKVHSSMKHVVGVQQSWFTIDEFLKDLWDLLRTQLFCRKYLDAIHESLSLCNLSGICVNEEFWKRLTPSASDSWVKDCIFSIKKHAA